MQHFKTALVRLTALYVGILMALALGCSVWLYAVASREVQTVLIDTKRSNVTGQVDASSQASRERLLQDLIFFNLFIFGAGTLASYALARRTLRPVQESYQAQEQFAADASHELRTPLTALKTELQLARRDAKKLTPDEYAATLDSSLEEVERLSLLTARLLRLTSSSQNNTAESASLQDCLAEAIRPLQSALDSKKIAVKYPESDDKIAMHPADQAELLRIILDNAIKYSPPKSNITITAEQSRENMVITIQDEGPGIAQQDLPHIFDRFYRGSSHDKAQTGYGLGLAVAKKLAASVGGSIKAQSQPGHGTTIILTIPSVISV